MADVKRVKMFPYYISLPDRFFEANFLLNKFSRARDKVEENIVQYGSNYILLLFEIQKNGFLQGRFLKLRMDAPRILNRQSTTNDAEERDIDLLDGEYIEEMSHFIISISDKRLLGEYNQAAVRHFVTPLDFYLREVLDLSSDQVKVKAIQIGDVLERIKAEEKLYSVRAKIAKPKLTYFEDKTGLDPARVLRKYRRSEFDIEISVTHLPRKILDKEEAFENIKELYDNKEELDALKVETKDAAYDLINGSLMHFRASVVLDKRARFVKSWDFYDKARNVYNSNRSAIMNSSGGEDES